MWPKEKTHGGIYTPIYGFIQSVQGWGIYNQETPPWLPKVIAI